VATCLPCSCELLEGLLGYRQHPARSAGAVVDQVGPGFDLIGDGQKDEPRHQLDGIARRPVLAGLLIVLLVEATDQLLEDRAHRVVVEARVLHRAVAVLHRVRAQVDGRAEELFNQGAERVGLGEARDLVAELEVVEDLLHVGREAIQIRLEIGFELLLAGAGAQIAQGKLRGVVERLPGGLTERLVLVRDVRPVERGLHVEHVLLGRLEDRVEPAQHRHRQDDVAVLAAHVEIAEHVVRDSPDEVGDPVKLGWFHFTPGDARAAQRSDH
jgi:hypothetical protein